MTSSALASAATRSASSSSARFAPGGRLLDLGCNDGAFTAELAGRVGATEVYGVEFVDSLAAEARARGVQVVPHDLNEPLPYDSESFDVVHSNQVIEHLVKTDVFVREIRRVLRPAGYALISTNNLASWHNLFSLALGMQPMPCHVSDEVVIGNRFNPRRGERHPEKGFTHLRIFSFEALRELLELHGLRVDESSRRLLPVSAAGCRRPLPDRPARCVSDRAVVAEFALGTRPRPDPSKLVPRSKAVCAYPRAST